LSVGASVHNAWRQDAPSDFFGDLFRVAINRLDPEFGSSLIQRCPLLQELSNLLETRLVGQ